MRHEINRDDIVPFEVTGGPAGGSGCTGVACPLGTRVNCDRQIVFGGRLVERVEKTLPEETGRSARHQDLDKSPVGRIPPDCPGGGGGVGMIDDNGAAKPRRMAEPAIGEVLVVRGRNHVAPVGIGMNRKSQHVRAGENGIVDAIAIEMITDQERGVAAGHAAGQRAGVFALDADRRDVASGRYDDAMIVRVDLPAAGQIGSEFSPNIGERVVDIGIDETGTGDGRPGGWSESGGAARENDPEVFAVSLDGELFEVLAWAHRRRNLDGNSFQAGGGIDEVFTVRRSNSQPCHGQRRMQPSWP